MLRAGDRIIIAAVAAAAAVSLALLLAFPPGQGRTVSIRQNETEVYRGGLYEEKTVELEGNTVVISDGVVSVTHADCKNRICVRHKSISRAGESIVCLPNRVIIEIE